MKKILSILAASMLAVSALATGAIGVNPPQSGTASFTSQVWTNTVTFAYPFQSVPVITSFYVSGPTNIAPLTNNAITTTNFNILINTTNSVGTNTGVVAWSAYVGGTRMQAGTNSLTAATPVTNTFAFPYAQIPIVVASGSSTNAATSTTVGVTLVTTTGFVITSGTTQAASWISIGTVANPASANTGQFPQNNSVLY